MILSPEKITAASDGFRAVFLKAYEGQEPDWMYYAMEVQSSSETETYDFVTGLPGMKELVGEVILEDVDIAGFAIKNKEWESTVPVKRALIERDSLGLVRPAMEELAVIARNHPRILLASLLSNGFVNKDYTESPFFSANKKYNPKDKSKGAATFTNVTSAPLSSDSLIAARTSLRKMKDAKGLNLGLGRKLVLIVPPALEEVANKLRTAENISVAGGSTETNTLRNTFEVVVINELATDTEWFLVEGGRSIKPLIVQFEVAPEFVAADDPRSEHVLLKKVFIYQAYGRWNAGYALPQLAYGSTGQG